MSKNSKTKGVPDRWLDYKPVGKKLSGTRFIAFKVPLKQSLNWKLRSSDVFGPWELLDAVSRQNQELGMIIDLTFTKRYYGVQDVPDSLLLVKILTAGHEVPSDATILSFKRAVRRFLRENADNEKLIGVHCTHGLNRTGYLICRYLIDVDGMEPEAAVQLFNSSRGHAVERQNYLDDLQRGPRRSNRGMEESEQEPIRGLASQRPAPTPNDADGRDERRTHRKDARQHSRSFAPRGSNHHHHHHDDHLQRRRSPRSEEGRLRHEPDRRPRYPGPEESRSWYPAPEQSRSWYPGPGESRSMYPAPGESRSRYPAQGESRSWYPGPGESRPRYPGPGESRPRYPGPGESRPSYRAPRLQEERRRGPPALLPRYTPRWANESNG